MSESSIFKIFSLSPISPIQGHMQKVYEAATKLEPFFTAVFAGEWPQASALRDEIAGLEHEADKMKRDIRLHLPKGLFMPVPRGDLLQILSKQDRVANRAKDIAGLIVGRQMQFPTAITASFHAFLQCSIKAAKQANKAIHELDELLATGFKGREVDLVQDMIVTLDEIEHQSDKLQVDLRQQLYALESELPPVDTVFMYKIIDWTGDLADRAQDIGGQLLLLLAK